MVFLWKHDFVLLWYKCPLIVSWNNEILIVVSCSDRNGQMSNTLVRIFFLDLKCVNLLIKLWRKQMQRNCFMDGCCSPEVVLLWLVDLQGQGCTLTLHFLNLFFHLKYALWLHLVFIWSMTTSRYETIRTCSIPHWGRRLCFNIVILICPFKKGTKWNWPHALPLESEKIVRVLHFFSSPRWWLEIK